MVEATIRVLGSDFNSDLIERIKLLLNGDIKNFEFQIQVTHKEAREARHQHDDAVIEGTELKDILEEEDEDIFENTMTQGQVTALTEAIKMSYSQKNLIPHSEAKKMIQQWLEKRTSNG